MKLNGTVRMKCVAQQLNLGSPGLVCILLLGTPQHSARSVTSAIPLPQCPKVSALTAPLTIATVTHHSGCKAEFASHMTRLGSKF